MDIATTPVPTEPTVTTVDGVVAISLSPDIVYPFLFLFTIYVGIALVRLVRSLSVPIGLKD